MLSGTKGAPMGMFEQMKQRFATDTGAAMRFNELWQGG